MSSRAANANEDLDWRVGHYVRVCWKRDTKMYHDALGILSDDETRHRTPHVHLGELLLLLEGSMEPPRFHERNEG